MERNNIPTGAKLEAYYIYKLLNITQKLNIKTMVWQEVFDNNVPVDKDTIVHVWKGQGFEHEMETVSNTNILNQMRNNAAV